MERGPCAPQRLDEANGEDNTTAATRANAAAPNSWTSGKPVGSPGSPQGSTVAGNDDVDAGKRAEVGCPPRGQQAVRGGITNMIAETMNGVAQGQEWKEKARQMTARTDGGGLEASQHADTPREEDPQKRQFVQQQPKPKLQLKLQPKPQPAPKPKSAPTPTRRWETVPPRAKSQKVPVGPAPPPRLDRAWRRDA